VYVTKLNKKRIRCTAISNLIHVCLFYIIPVRSAVSLKTSIWL